MVSGNVSSDLLNMALRQLGATSIDSKICKMNLIKFEISDDLTLSYICNTVGQERIYMMRLSPYPIRNARFDSVDSVVEYISRDITLFKNATLTNKYSTFLDILDKSSIMREEIENLFLFYKIDRDTLDKINEEMDDIIEKIKNTDKKQLQEIIDIREEDIPKHTVDIDEL